MIIKGQISFLKSVLYLAAVIQAGSITNAAQHNGIKQTNLSRMIKDLEETVGVPLIIRKSNGVQATQAGLQLYEKAVQLEKELNLVQELKAKPRRQIVTLYLPESISLNFLKQFVKVKIVYACKEQTIDVGIFNEKPTDLSDEFQIGEYSLRINGLCQKIWIACLAKNPNACQLTQFIISKLFPEDVPSTP